MEREGGVEMDDVARAFAEMTFVPGLKISKRGEFVTYFAELKRRAERASALLRVANEKFVEVGLEALLQVCLDESVVARTEFTLLCRSSKCMVSVGSAHLNTRIAVLCYLNRQATAQDYQNLRDQRCKQTDKAVLFDRLFGKNAVLLFWGFEDGREPSTRQKADFVDALIGMLFLRNKWSLADWVCHELVGKF